MKFDGESWMRVNNVDSIEMSEVSKKRVEQKIRNQLNKKEFKIDFEFQETDELNKFRKLMNQQYDEAMQKFYAEIEVAIENILRNHVTPPIQGDITPTKLRWRGIKGNVFVRDENEQLSWVGLIQRDDIIFSDGRRMLFNDFVTNNNLAIC